MKKHIFSFQEVDGNRKQFYIWEPLFEAVLYRSNVGTDKILQMFLKPLPPFVVADSFWSAGHGSSTGTGASE